MTFRLHHLIAALVLHVALIALLVGGVQCSSKPIKPPVIRAVLLNPDRKEAALQKQREERERQQRKREAEAEVEKKRQEDRRRAEAEQQKREAEIEKQKQLDQQLQKQLADKQKREEDTKRQKQLAEQKKAEDLARKKKEQEEERERQEQAQRDLQERARMEEEMRQESMRREIAQESAQHQATERERKLSEWSDMLQRHIQKYWIRPASAAADFQCTVHVQLLPDGSVTFAKIDKSCGSGALDKSVEDAVFRASPLPRPSDMSVFDRDLIITFVPK
jgi:colicin import membrane protein